MGGAAWCLSLHGGARGAGALWLACKAPVADAAALGWAGHREDPLTIAAAAARAGVEEAAVLRAAGGAGGGGTAGRLESTAA